MCGEGRSWKQEAECTEDATRIALESMTWMGHYANDSSTFRCITALLVLHLSLSHISLSLFLSHFRQKTAALLQSLLLPYLLVPTTPMCSSGNLRRVVRKSGLLRKLRKWEGYLPLGTQQAEILQPYTMQSTSSKISPGKLLACGPNLAPEAASPKIHTHAPDVICVGQMK